MKNTWLFRRVCTEIILMDKKDNLKDKPKEPIKERISRYWSLRAEGSHRKTVIWLYGSIAWSYNTYTF